MNSSSMDKNRTHSYSTSRTPSNNSTSFSIASTLPSTSNSTAPAANIQNSTTNSHSHTYRNTTYSGNYSQQQSNHSYPQHQQKNQSNQSYNRSYPQHQQPSQSYQQQSNRWYPQQQQSNRLYQQQQSNRSYPQQQQSNRSYPQQQSNRLYQQQQSNRSYPQQQQSNRSYPQQQSNRSYPQRQGAYQGAMDNAQEKMRRESRSKRFGNARVNQAESSFSRPKTVGAGVSTRSSNYQEGNNAVVKDIDVDSFSVKGTCQEVEKCYLRLTSAPDPATVRPEEVLEKALLMVQKSQKNYLYKCDQLKSIRQDLTVQRIRNELTVKVYETHARLAIEVGDLSEYNQCQSQLQELYAEGNKGCDMEFSAYNLLTMILHSNNNRDLLSAMSRLSVDARKDAAVKHALAVRAAVTSGNYVLFFRLYKEAPNLSTCLMDLYVDKMRYTAVKCISRSYRPTLPVAYIAQILGFSSILLPAEPSDEKDANGLGKCAEWLKTHGACLMDNTGDLLLDTKASTSSLFMPKPEVEVAHGDATLSVNDFLTRAFS